MAHVNVALIGYAFMGRAHSNAWRQVARFFTPKLTPRMKVICGRDAKNVKEAAERLGWDEAATDWQEVVNRPDIDIVDISTPGDSHAEIAIAAARAGKVVFCEKPLANTVREAQQMLAAVQKAGVVHMICHNYRRAPAVMLARQLIEEGKLGRLYHYRGTYLQDWVADPSVPLYWRLQKDKAGLRRARRHRVALARPRPLPGRRDHGGHRPHSRRSSRNGRCPTTRRRRGRSPWTTPRRRSCGSTTARSARSRPRASPPAGRTTTASRSTAARARSRSTWSA